ncbi:acyl-CoA acyltransferase [Deinococcus koreensis]|uniref:Acyl-CoA acyltransferase n=1 Tax=Deinococcus koreensis TaxID=2054903 RepID=A0A2K3UWT0_9DEIO|nr:acyl-CoA acyltransferase [Deinococcus koreensis]PNY80996.1 acyl-CoA acyltransferase [Deinococcus koreensis]
MPEGEAAAPRPHATGPYVIRDVTDPWALRALEGVQVAAWGYADREVTPGTLLRISAVTGGIVLGAYPAQGEDQQTPVGLAFGFPALAGGQAWHHSHLLAVRPGWRGSGLAVALKLAQRERALAQGLTRMTWTFDPLLARNARLNLGKLGAVAVSYHPDWYALSDDRDSAFPADRLMVEWDLTRPHAGRPAPPPDGRVVLERQGAGPGTPRLDHGGGPLLAEVPTSLEALDEEQQRAWRLALRGVLMAALERGYAVSDLAREGDRAYYVLSRR